MSATNAPTLRTWTFMWFAAAERQLERVTSSGVGAASPEAFLYVDCMRNAYRGAARLLGEGHPQVVRFLEAVPDVKAIRDMLQHFDEYIEGRGRLQKSGQVDQDWLIYASGNSRTDERRIHVEGMVIELPRDHLALVDLVRVALEEDGAGITPVSEGGATTT